MKTNSIILFAGLLLPVFIGCNNDTMLPVGTTGSNVNVPSVTISAITDITSTTAAVGGGINSDGGSAVTSRGVCWSTSSAPTTADSKTSDGTGTGSFTSTITGLSVHTVYYARAYAANNAGTAYSSELSFLTSGTGGPILFNPTLTYGSVTDADGNVYKTIQIGTQTWMAENLKTTKYRNGDPISNLTAAGDWSASTSGAYCWYNNDITNKATYGALYNLYAVKDSRSIAPAGWHVPTSNEVVTLMTYLESMNDLGGSFTAGGKLKKTGVTHWASPNAVATNESGFTALPGGIRSGSSFYDIEKRSYYSLFPPAPYSDLFWTMSYNDGGLSMDSAGDGFSVRCIKD
jgi:uncharacterized protein (TIGR02145 family)